MRTACEVLLGIVILVCVSNALYDFMGGDWKDGAFLVAIIAIAVLVIAGTHPSKGETASPSD